MAAKYKIAVDVLDTWKEDVLTGTPPTLYPVGTGDLARIEIGPGTVTLLGGAPGSGKTAFTMQLVLDALRLTPDLRAVVCNVEMPPTVLLDRQLARLSGVPLELIRHRKLEARHAERIAEGFAILEPLAERFAFVSPPFDLGNVAATADDFQADLIVLDYIQRIRPPEQHDNHRNAVNQTMDYLRQFADAGTALIVVSAVGRSRDNQGRSSYNGNDLNLASFRESSELEFGADDAFILAPSEENKNWITLKHLKSRHGECKDIFLTFHKNVQRFENRTASTTAKKEKGKLGKALADLWNSTEPATVDEESEDQ